jgi:Ras-related GTP-binding protein C/D
MPQRSAGVSPANSDFDTGSRAGASGGSSSRILLMGLKRSGKTSIYQVVFHKMSPHETLFLESTMKTTHHDVRNISVVHFKVSDFPGSMQPEDLPVSDRSVFAHAEAVLFVIDGQDELGPAIARLVATIEKAYVVNRRINFEIFIHKVDGLSQERKLELQREVSQQVTKQLSLKQLDDANRALYLSSIYDQSIYENISKVVQKLVPSLAILENLLDVLISNCRMHKAFLFDVLTKVDLSTESLPASFPFFFLFRFQVPFLLKFRIRFLFLQLLLGFLLRCSKPNTCR